MFENQLNLMISHISVDQLDLTSIILFNIRYCNRNKMADGNVRYKTIYDQEIDKVNEIESFSIVSRVD